MGDCDEVLERLHRYLDGECPRNLERIVREHLEECPPCLDRADFQRELRALIASKCKEAAPPGLLDRILAQLERLERR
ncbi:MAG: mycothiol system anti-sigma-R factor [Egibacteraceae bacterium]